jgi:23S rRNA pseudouridine1911/1915/1917 synthase
MLPEHRALGHGLKLAERIAPGTYEHLFASVPNPELLEINPVPGERIESALQRALALRYPDASKRQIKHALEEGVIRTLPPTRDRPHALRFEVQWAELDARLGAHTHAPRSAGCGIELIHEDDKCCIFYKPSGLPSEPISRSGTDTALHHALAHDPNLMLLHRLDTGTSGLLAFARTKESHEFLKQAWRDRQVRKFYRALVTTPISAPVPRLIDAPLGHDPKSNKRMRVVTPGHKIRGKPLPARTTLMDCRTVAGPESRAGEPTHEVTIELHTGVMHQIRVHLASQGAPILGDALYGGEPSERLWLEAWRLELPTPRGGVTSVEKKQW